MGGLYCWCLIGMSRNIPTKDLPKAKSLVTFLFYSSGVTSCGWEVMLSTCKIVISWVSSSLGPEWCRKPTVRVIWKVQQVCKNGRMVTKAAHDDDDDVCGDYTQERYFHPPGTWCSTSSFFLEWICCCCCSFTLYYTLVPYITHSTSCVRSGSQSRRWRRRAKK